MSDHACDTDTSAAFEIADQHRRNLEGWYVDDPNDAGGETWSGIARQFNGDAPVWPIIDAHKASGLRGAELSKALRADAELAEATAAWFRRTRWDPIRGDDLPLFLALELYDQAVQWTAHTAAVRLQRALNVSNRRASDWDDLVVDGRIGPRTLEALGAAIHHTRYDTVVGWLLTLKGAAYLESLERRERNERYAAGWAERVYSSLGGLSHLDEETGS